MIVFFSVQAILWSLGTDSMAEITAYLRDFSWIEGGTASNSPYPNEAAFATGVIWGIVFIADLIYSWSYTLFPKK